MRKGASLKLGFVLLSNRRAPQPSTRISVLNVLPALPAHGVSPEILFEPPDGCETPDVDGVADVAIANGFDAVYFQKVCGPSVWACMDRLRAGGVRTIFGVCDWVDVETAGRADMVIVPTEFLKTLYPASLQSRIAVVHDGIEHPELVKMSVSANTGVRSRPLQAAIVTSQALMRLPELNLPPRGVEVSVIGAYMAPSARLARLKWNWWRIWALSGLIAKLKMLQFLVHPRIRTLRWDPTNVYTQLLAADIGCIPIDRSPSHAPEAPAPQWQVKSENRLTLLMALGLPVVATPIPAYEAIVESGRNGYLVETRRDWLDAFRRLRDPAHRREVGAAARADVVDRFSRPAQVTRLVAALVPD